MSANSTKHIAKRKIRKRETLLDYPAGLRGSPNNRWGGHQSQHMRAFKGSKFGPASPVKHYTADEIREYEHQMRRHALPQGAETSVT